MPSPFAVSALVGCLKARFPTITGTATRRVNRCPVLRLASDKRDGFVANELKSPASPIEIEPTEIIDELSASPEHYGHRSKREHLIESIDQRLQVPNVSGVTVSIELSDGSTLEAGVFALTRFDIVVCLDDSQTVPDVQAIEFVLNGDKYSSEKTDGLLHWKGKANGKTIIGIFAALPIARQIYEKTTGDRRSEIRYPLNVKTIVRGNQFREEGQVIDYSLNGIGIQLDKPIELDQRYEATIMLDGQILKLPMLCRFNARSNRGYIVGCGLRCLEGSLLVCSAFRKIQANGRPVYSAVSPRFPALNLISGRGEPREFDMVNVPTRYERFVHWFNNTSETLDERLSDRPVISRAAILILAAILMGMSLKAAGKIQIVTALYSVFGVLAYIGLTHAANLQQRRKEDEAIRIKRELAERRLVTARTDTRKS